jgi:hypothetical protein
MSAFSLISLIGDDIRLSMIAIDLLTGFKI